MKIMVFLLISISSVAFSQANHILLTEICETPTDAEFIEIYNPTGSAIALDNVHLTDLYGDSSCIEQFYPQIPLGPIDPQYTSDFLVKFPGGTQILPGEVIIIAMSGSTFYTVYGTEADYDIEGSGSGAVQMTVPTNGFSSNSSGLTNSGETVTLFYYDDSDSDDLCYDIDYASWGDDPYEFVDKTGIVINTSYYLDDIPWDLQDPIAAGSHSAGNTFQRVNMWEGNEILTGGNGITGHNETSEDLSQTWTEAEPTPGSVFTSLERGTWGSIKAVF